MDHHFTPQEGDMMSGGEANEDCVDIEDIPTNEGEANFETRKWNEYFDTQEFVHNDIVRLPSPQGWEVDKEQAVLFCVHGAGYSALSFALLTRYMPGIAIISVDLRGHGSSHGGMDEESTIDALVGDVSFILGHYKRQCTARHSFFLLGHSLGGSIVARLFRGNAENCCSVLGIALIDIVEETSLWSIPKMPTYLRSRPAGWSTLEGAIQWAIQSKHNRLLEAALISMPDQLRNHDAGGRCDRATLVWKWKVDLMKSEGCWDGWFTGLSDVFVSNPANKLLFLAEREHLDRPLMIASMQGKFQCSIIQDSGHAIQEDQPEHMAAILLSFINRNLEIECINNRKLSIHR